ncbi:MAG: hypothetical protein KF802_10540 [Bdellovibrionaceae bacterium]|nr:hypothetical protein [Pseudobdellovibrionaceae bacterium]
MFIKNEVNDMRIKSVMSLVVTVCLTACGGGGFGGGSGGSSETAIEGLDLSGTWRFAGVECYDSSLQNPTAGGIPSTSSPVGTSVIKGNQLISEDLSLGTCKISMNRRIVAKLQAGNASGGYGLGKFGATTASVTPGSSCSVSTSFDMITGNITPTTLSSTYTQGQLVPEQDFEFLLNPPYLAFTSLIQVVGRPTDICFLIMRRL